MCHRTQWSIFHPNASVPSKLDSRFLSHRPKSFPEFVMTDPGESHHCDTAEGLAAFVESKRPQLLAYIQHNVGPALRAKLEPDDILQEVVLTALGTLETFNVRGRDPFRLLCQIAEQRIIDAHRHYIAAQKRSAGREVSFDTPLGGHEPFGFINLLVASMTSPSQAFSRGQKELHLQEAIMSLPPEQRELLRLRFVDGLPTKEVADRLGKTDGAIRVLLTRTLSRLQELLSDS
jgi:RNA polymerase sigma-70 factor (ECF subfamily)